MESRHKGLSAEAIASLEGVKEGDCARIDRDDGSSIIALRREGLLRMFLNRCPHRGIELDWVPGKFLAVDGYHLQCATHGALFDPLSGQCISGPCAGDGLARLDTGH